MDSADQDARDEMEVDDEEQNTGGDDEEDESDDDFGQKLPPLHIYVKRVLDKYPDGGQILKELLQNADDAGASEIIFLHDKTQHPTKHLWSQSLKKFNGPALYAYNNSTFKDSDWRNIQHPEQSGKHEDPTKVGRFGLGFISVYHLTDMPCIFSARYVGFLDPHERYFGKGKRGKKWHISKDCLQRGVKDQFSPYLNPIFKCNESTFKKGIYEGTIFRFPLRMENSKSKISRGVYSEDRVQSLFQSFQNDAEISLLFLKNIESVSMYEKAKSDESAKLLFKVEISPEDRAALRKERSGFLQTCQENVAPTDGLTISRCQVSTITSTVTEQVTENGYLIVNVLKRIGLSRVMQDLMQDADLKQLPWVGLAMKIRPVVGARGRMFCFLPLPKNECSRLPVHVHGYFGLGDNRRSIKWPDQESEHDNAARWNVGLVEEVFPDAYLELMKMAITQNLPASSVYKLWPEVGNLTGAWKDGVKRLITQLGELPVLYTKVKGGSWKEPTNVYIDPEKNDLLHKVMLRKGLPIVHLPENVLEALHWGGIQFEEVKPVLVRQVVRVDKLEWLDRHEKIQLLQYILRDQQFKDMEDIHLLPLQDGDFIPFTSNGETIYIPNSKVPHYLFPGMDTSLSADDCPEILKSQKAQQYTQLQSLTINLVPSLLQECLPEEWRNGEGIVTWTPGKNGQPEYDWLKKLWNWLQQENTSVSLHSLVSLPLVQIRSSSRPQQEGASVTEDKMENKDLVGETFQLARLETNRLIYHKDITSPTPVELSNNVSTFLESLGATVVRNDELPEFIGLHPKISSFIKTANGEGVMQILESLSQDKVIKQVTKSQDCLKKDLVAVLLQTTLTGQWKILLRKLPLFQVNDRDFVSVEKCSEDVKDFVSVDKCSKGVKSDCFGIPIKKVSQTRILLDKTTTLALTLGVKEETVEEFLTTCVLPGVESHYYSQLESDEVMKWVLERGHLDNLVRNLKFLCTSEGSYSTPSKLFDPANSLLTDLYNKKPVFPTGKYSKGRLLDHIKRIGLKQESSISAKEILEIADEIAKTSEHTRGKALLHYICKYPDCLTHKLVQQPLGKCLSNISWVACESSPPPSYPACFPWCDKNEKLNCPSEVKLLQDAILLGSAVPLVRVLNYHTHFGQYFGWNSGSASITVDSVLQHLKNITTTETGSQDRDNITKEMSAIYSFFDKVSDQMKLKQYFSTGGIMASVPWVWHGNGFTTPDKVAFNTKVSSRTYLQKIPSKLKKFKRVLLHLGVRESFRVDDYINVLQHIQMSKEGNSVDPEEMKVVKEIIEAITTADDFELQAYHNRLYVLDCNSVLRHIDKVIYNDDDDPTITDALEDFIDAHHSVTSRQAKLLGVRTRREIQLDGCSTDLGFELPFGQTEKLTTRLSGILREYSHTPDVLKELLQNADDAGATEIHVVYDPRKHKGKRIAGPEWKPMHNAPALCVYNDKPFTDEDIKGIQEVGVGGKTSDATTTGRFGIGFNSVYHLTDCPTFLTQGTSKLCIFDPHVKYVPRATIAKPGKLYSQTGRLDYKATFPDMLEGYLENFEEFDLQNGTMFRFPLRQDGMESEISDKYYTSDKVETLLTEFERTSKHALLFLNNVQKISISEINPETEEIQLRYSVSAKISESDKKHRLDVSAQLQKYKDSDAINRSSTQVKKLYRLHLTESTRKRRRRKNLNEEEWLVCQTIGFDKAQVVNLQDFQVREFKTKSFIPRGGVAALMNGTMSPGKAFCFLPLQITTGLPVHVNGTFVLDQSRQNLKKGDKGMIHRWNSILAEQVIAPAYASLIEGAGKILFQSQSNRQHIHGMWICKQLDTLFPANLDSYFDVWKLVATSTFRFIGINNMKVMPVVRSTKSKVDDIHWCSPDQSVSNAYFDDLSRIDEDITSKFNTSSSSSVLFAGEKKSHTMRLFLQSTRFNLISCSGGMYKAFKRVGINAAYISPEACCQHIKVIKTIAGSLPCQISESKFQSTSCLKIVLEYCLNGLHQVHDLMKLPFQLDGSNTLGTFSPLNAKYISYDNGLLPSHQELFLHRDIIATMSQWLNKADRRKDAYDSGILKCFTVHELAKHIDSVLLPQWRGLRHHVNWQPAWETHPSVVWLQMLWTFLCGHNSDNELRALEDWPIIPTTKGQLVSLKMAKTILFLRSSFDTSVARDVTNALQKLGCPVVDVSQMTTSKILPTKLMQILTKFVATPHSQDDVLSVLQYMITTNESDLTGRLIHSECDTLLWYFQTAIICTRIDTLRHLPLFRMANTQYRTSIHQFQSCYTYLEPLTIPEIDLDKWMTDKGRIFLEYDINFAVLYDRLGIKPVGAMDIYKDFVLPDLHKLPVSTAVLHIKFIRDNLLLNAIPEDRVMILNILKDIKFIPSSDGQFHEAAYFFNINNKVFAKMIESKQLLPEDFCTQEWLSFLVSIGLHTSVTGDLCIKFAQEIEEGSQQIMNEKGYEDLKEKAFILLSEFRSNASGYDNKTLDKIATIRCIPSAVIDDERKQIHPQFIQVTPNTNGMYIVCFKESVPECHIDLVWTVAPLLRTSVVPKDKRIQKRLGIEVEPPVSKVLQHMRNVCNKMAEHNAYDKEDSMASVRAILNRTVDALMDHLKNKLTISAAEITKELQDLPICLVEEGTILVKAKQLVYELAKDTGDLLKPYIYKAPRTLGQYDELLRVLGAQDEMTFDQLAMVLERIKGECKDKKMMSNERQKAHCASRFLFSLLQSTDGKCPLSVTKLYLPTKGDNLTLSTNLHYTDLNESEAKELPLSSDTEYITHLKQLLGDQPGVSPTLTEERLIQLLPQNLQPQKITTYEKPLDSNIPCGCSECPLVIQIQFIINSQDTQDILPRLLQHQTDQAPDQVQKDNIAKLSDFNNIFCVQELKTGYFDGKGKLVGERNLPREVFLTQTQDQSTLFFSHNDVSDHVESGSVFYLPLARSINRICALDLNKLHIQYLSQVLPLPSSTLKNRFLTDCDIPVYENLSNDLPSTLERPGSIVPSDILCLFDDSMANKFNPGDVAVYKQLCGDEGENHVYAIILERLPLPGDSAIESTSFLRKYKIDIGESCPKVVSVVELFMFRRPKEDTDSSERQEASSVVECTQSGGSSSGARSGRIRSNISGEPDFETVKARIRKEVEEAKKLPDAERKECLRRLYRMWHPDKNPDQVALATQAFQFLKQEIKRVNKGSSVSFDQTYSKWNADISRDREEEQHYRQQSRQRSHTSSHRDSGQSQFYPHSFTNRRPDLRKAKLWYRQAEEDFKAAKVYQQKQVKSSQAWTALMIQQAAEKALKALNFFLDGSQSMSHNLHHLLAVACQHQVAKVKENELRNSINQLVQLRCDAIRPRYPEDGTSRTTGELYHDFDAPQAFTICQTVLSIVSEILAK